MRPGGAGRLKWVFQAVRQRKALAPEATGAENARLLTQATGRRAKIPTAATVPSAYKVVFHVRRWWRSWLRRRPPEWYERPFILARVSRSRDRAYVSRHLLRPSPEPQDFNTASSVSANWLTSLRISCVSSLISFRFGLLKHTILHNLCSRLV